MAITVGLVNLDPISGLIDYVTDIKPYHTKIFETLVEYVYTDSVAVTITENDQWNIISAPIDNNDITITEFVETLAFGWDANYTYTIANIQNSAVYINQNISTVTKPYDAVTITASTDNNGSYTVVSVLYDPGIQQTIVTLTPALSGVSTNGTFTVQDIDVPYWYQFSIIRIDPALNEETVYTAPITPVPLSSFSWSNSDGIPPNILSTAHYADNAITAKIVLDGNATTAIQVGAEFQLVGTSVTIGGGITSDDTFITSDSTLITSDSVGSITSDSTLITSDDTDISSDSAGTTFSSDGVYHALTVRYDPIQNVTTIGVNLSTLIPSPYQLPASITSSGFAQPYRYIGEQIGSYDTPYDVNNYDTNTGILEINSTVGVTCDTITITTDSIVITSDEI